MMKVTNELTVYKVDGKTESVGGRNLIVESVWINRQLVRLMFDGLSIEVGKDELLMAISNATNHD
jgi:hypothetical protein